MSRRIEIEITSLQGDVATWRAAGAKLPKGVLSASLVPGGPVVGNVYRADIEQMMEGIEILSIMAPKTASPLDPRHERLELIPTVKSGPDVIVTYAPKGRGGSRRDGERHEGDGRRDGAKHPSSRPGSKDRPPSPDRPDRGPRTESTERGPRPERTERGPRSESTGRSGPRSESTGRGGPRSESTGRGGPRSESTGRGAPRSESTGRGGPRSEHAGRGERHSGPSQPPMSTTHRNALLATLSPEQLPVAEQLLRGGMPAVRAAVAEQNKNATAQGRTTIDPATIDRIAEDLLSRTTLALWTDRAT
ncbi:MAG TPA: hypothetical protein VII84_06415, partial [Acidimicrobiales bacterium]